MRRLYLVVRLVALVCWVGCLVALRRLFKGPRRPGWRWSMETTVTLMRRGSRRMLGKGPEQLHAWFEELSSLAPPLSKKFCTESLDAGGVPCTWVRRAGDDAIPGGVLLYLHGGGYFTGSTASHRQLIARLVRATGLPALSVEYRLSPKHTFPAPVEDALSAYRWLLSTGVRPEHIIVGGDSAGGGLALALLLSLRDAGEPLPAGAVLLSPWVDLAASGGSLERFGDIDYLGADPDKLREVARWYAGEAALTTPLVSPGHADLAGLPPLLVDAGGAEIFHDQITAFAERAMAAGVEVELRVWDEMVHVFQAFEMCSESRDAIARIGRFGRARVDVVSEPLSEPLEVRVSA